MLKRSSLVFAIAVIVLGLMMPVKTALGQSSTLPPLAVLAGQWWQWALSIPVSVNPLSDSNGQNCMVGQRDVVWFLAGVFGGSGSATRSCSVPANTALFFPVINAVNVNTPNCGQNGQNLTAQQLLSAIKPFIDSAHDLSVKVDGKLVQGFIAARRPTAAL
jgi:hypothetical protein